MRDPESRPAFAAFIASRSRKLTVLIQSVTTALATVAGAEAIPLLRAALTHPDPVTRVAAARSLYELDDRASVPAITAATTGSPMHDAELEEYARRLRLVP